MNGNAKVVQELINYNATLEDVNNFGETALLLAAASFNGEECLEMLLDEGIPERIFNDYFIICVDRSRC